MTLSAYPAHLETDVVLRTGRTLHIRPVRHEDGAAMRAFFAGLSSDALHSRFFHMVSVDAALASAPIDVDYDNVVGLAGEVGGEIVGVAHAFRSPQHGESAEVAFTIADRHSGAGVATHLLERLAEIARAKAVKRFEADVLAANQPMLDVFRSSGFDLKVGSREGVVHVSLSLEQTEHFVDRAAGRAQAAASASMRPIFAPRSIVVIGASRRRGNLGAEVLHNLVAGGFRGALYAVNPNAQEIEGVPCCASVRDLDAPIDLAIVAVPAIHVEGVIDDCIAKGVSASVVISAGFGETGTLGREMEHRLVEKVRGAGMRMVGPNCMGVINTDPAVQMQATFVAADPLRGNIAMSSQSGALGLAVLDYARGLDVGFSSFISVGNKADVSGNDLIQYWADDPATDVILLYLESFGNPRKFAEIARRVSRRKPIVAVKAGRSAAGARAAQSHTGALASSDAIVGDLFRQAGIIRAGTLEEMFDVAALLSQQPLPAGRRVGIVTNAGGAGILAADACEANSLELPMPSPELVEKLRAFLPAAASFGNPVDMIASASAEQYRRAIRAMLDDGSFDTVLAIYIPVLPADAAAVANAIRECAAEANGKTMLATFMGSHGAPQALAPVPSFAFPERAVAALARAITYAEWCRGPAGTVPSFSDIAEDRARSVVDRKLAAGGGWLDPLDVAELLAAININVPPAEQVASADDAIEAAIRIGCPVVLKALGPTLLHKTEAGGVVLNLTSEDAVRQAYLDLHRRLGEAMTGALVQQMIEGGVEAMIGATEQPTFGHVLAYGAGGTLVELLGDVAFRLQPLTDTDADAMVEEVRFTKLLRGFRGSDPADIAAVKDALLRLSTLLTLCPEIREIDINPLKVHEHGVVALDARVRVEAIVPVPASRRITY
ncbi:MAG TPA: GNAT family N-acetyltransferase [Thermoanaerobaculia bacterium]|jgi:acetyl coenzyme A synthetase (ADP forming)-like protein|nr:GNAT family N-acetyltransferase [Thermoanaerobaculia bacterium]